MHICNDMETTEGIHAAGAALDELLRAGSKSALDILEASSRCCVQIQRALGQNTENFLLADVHKVVTRLQPALRAVAELADKPLNNKLAVYSHDAWTISIFPTISNCLLSESWHAKALEADRTPNSASFPLFQSAVRDLLKEGLIPVAVAAASVIGVSQQHTQHGQHHLSFILHVAQGAAETIGWRHPGVVSQPSLRSYALVNVAWMGVLAVCSAVPKSERVLVLGHTNLMNILSDYLQKDFEMVLSRKEPSEVKLLQFWLANMSKLLSSFPEYAEAAFAFLVHWMSWARAKLMNVSFSDDTESQRDLTNAVAAGSIWVRAVRIQANALVAMPQTAAAQAVASLGEDFDRSIACCGEIPSRQEQGEESTSSEATHGSTPAAILFCCLELLGAAGTMPAVKRAVIAPLVRKCLDCLTVPACSAHLGASSEHSMAAADAITSCGLAFCAAGSVPNIDPMAVHAWEEFQLCLLWASVRPHPTALSVLTTVWTTLAAKCEETCLKHFVSNLYELLLGASAIHAIEEEFPKKNASFSVEMQLVYLLASLLAVAPHQLRTGFFKRYLGCIDDQQIVDRCSLASLVATLRVAATVKDPDCCEHGVPLLRRLLQAGKECTETQTPAQQAVYLAWLTKAIDEALRCLGLFVKLREEGSKQCVVLVEEAYHVVVNVVANSAHGEEAYIPAALRCLYTLWELHSNVFKQSDVELLLEKLESFALNNPSVAGLVAKLTPLFRDRPSPPKALIASLLGDTSRSPAVLFLAKEGYVRYAQECGDRSNVLRALPDHWLVPGGGALQSEIQPVMEKYLLRKPSSGCTLPAIWDAKTATQLEAASKMSVARLESLALCAATAPVPDPPRLADQDAAETEREVDKSVTNVVDSVKRVLAQSAQGGMQAASIDALRWCRDVLSSIVS